VIFFPIAFIAGKKYSKSSELKEEMKNQKKILKEAAKLNEIKPVE